MRPSYADIDLGAIAHNVKAYKRFVSPARICAVVKADGYGHGDVPVAQAALDAGASSLAVATVQEGIRLREAGLDAPILLLSEPAPSAIARLLQWRLTPTVYHREFVQAMSEVGTGLGAFSLRVPLHVKVDTGMHRVGAGLDDAIEIAAMIHDAPKLDLEGVWTHFAVAEEDEEFTRVQIDRFDEFLERLRELDIPTPVRHVANTAGIHLGREAAFDMVRLGIGLYGLQPDPSRPGPVAIRPAMRVVSEVSHVRRLPAGARPSYGRRRALDAESNVATVPIGYADGVPRPLSSHGEVLIRGRRFPLAGSITMDQIVVDCGDEPVEVGDEVVLIGEQGPLAITADDWARHLGTINYEVVCRIGPRLPAPVLVSLTDVAGVKVGHWTDSAARTGCTVIVLPSPNVTAVDIRGACLAAGKLPYWDTK